MRDIFLLFLFLMASNSYAQIQGTDDFRVSVETGVEDTRFESDRMDLTHEKEPQQKAQTAGILLESEESEGFKLLETDTLQNTLPEPVTTRRRSQASNAVLQSASVPTLASPSEIDASEDSGAGGGLFWAIIAGVGLLFIVLLLLLRGGSGDEKDDPKKRRVEIR